MGIPIIQEKIKPNKASFWSQLGLSTGQAFGQGAQEGLRNKVASNAAKEQEARALQTYQQLTGQDLSGLGPEERKTLAKEILAQQGKQGRLEQTQDFLGKLFGGGGVDGQSPSVEGLGEGMSPSIGDGARLDMSKLNDSDIASADVVMPGLGKLLAHQKDVALREKREEEQNKRKQFIEERDYHTKGSTKQDEEFNQLVSNIPKKEFALNLARDAISSGDLTYFSLDNLANALDNDLFRTAKGAQLITAAKENLLSNMSRVSAKGQNMWFEQRLNSMFPKIGQSNEANLTSQEIIEGEVAMDKAYADEYQRLTEEDEKNFGFGRKDRNVRARQAIKPLEKHIFNRTMYRLKEQEEQEKGLSKLKKEVGQNVARGTPLTLAMAKLYVDKFGDKAMEVLKKNGYEIPSLEEYQAYQMTPQEFREDF